MDEFTSTVATPTGIIRFLIMRREIFNYIFSFSLLIFVLLICCYIIKLSHALFSGQRSSAFWTWSYLRICIGYRIWRNFYPNLKTHSRWNLGLLRQLSRWIFVVHVQYLRWTISWRTIVQISRSQNHKWEEGYQGSNRKKRISSEWRRKHNWA